MGLYLSSDVWLPLSLFGAALSFFHTSELAFAFIINKKEACSLESCLISWPYLLAMTGAIIEYVCEASVAPPFKLQMIVPGCLLMGTGELIRKSAMMTARQSFTHKIWFDGHPTYDLITTGPYRYMRHPGYFGWMVWAFGTQVLLSNPVCAVAFLIAGWRFFKERIAAEESNLIRLFGQGYLAYMQATPLSCPPIA